MSHQEPLLRILAQKRSYESHVRRSLERLSLRAQRVLEEPTTPMAVSLAVSFSNCGSHWVRDGAALVIPLLSDSLLVLLPLNNHFVNVFVVEEPVVVVECG